MSTLTLILDPDCPWNCTLDDPEGYIIYDVKTAIKTETNYTFIRDGSDQVIATLKWRDVLPDMIMITEGQFMSVNSWLKKSLMPFNLRVSVEFSPAEGFTHVHAVMLSLKMMPDEVMSGRETPLVSR
jgi:hypothetical protein